MRTDSFGLKKSLKVVDLATAVGTESTVVGMKFTVVGIGSKVRIEYTVVVVVSDFPHNTYLTFTKYIVTICIHISKQNEKYFDEKKQ